MTDVAARIIARPFNVCGVDVLCPAGWTISDMLAAHAPLAERIGAIVDVSGTPISRSAWSVTIPQAGDVVSIRVFPEGTSEGSEKDALRTLLAIGVMAASWWAGGAAAGALGFAKGGFAATMAQAFTAAGMSAAGLYAINKLVPLPQVAGAEKDEPRIYSITSTANAIDRYGAIPKIYGKVRVYPKLGALPYTEICGNDQYLRMLFVVGYGPLILSDFKIGETDLLNFDAQIEVREGYDSDTAITLYPGIVIEDSQQILLTYDNWIQRTTEGECAEISLDITFPAGLVVYDDEDGHRIPRTVSFDLNYRKVGDTDWLPSADPAVESLLPSLDEWTAASTAEINGDLNIALCVESASVPTSADAKWKSWLEARDFVSGVTYQDIDSVSVATLESYDLVFMAASCAGDADCAKCKGLEVPVVFVNALAYSLMKFGTGSTSYASETQVYITDNSHYMTSPFSVGLLTVQAAQKLNIITGYSADVTRLAGYSTPGSTAAILYLDRNGEHTDTSTSVERIVFCGVGCEQDTGLDLTADGVTLVERAIKWAAGLSDGIAEITGINGSITSPYIDTNFMPTIEFVSQHLFFDLPGTTSRTAEWRFYFYDEYDQPVTNDNGNQYESDVFSADEGTWFERVNTVVCGSRVRNVKIRLLAYLSGLVDPRQKCAITSFVRQSTIHITGRTVRTLRRGYRFMVSEQAQYEVRIKRTTATGSEFGECVDDAYWTALRAITGGDPITMGGLCKVALRIKANEQLNGPVSQFNCLASSVLPVYSGGSWTNTETANPAWALCDMLRGSASRKVVPDANIDLATISTWASICASLGYDIDACVDARMTRYEGLRAIAAAGRGSFQVLDGKYTVLSDYYPSSTIAQHFTPRNSWGFHGSLSCYETPHALKIRFRNENEDYREDMRYVYADGYDADTATLYEDLNMWGITDPDIVWKEGRYHLAVMEQRGSVYTLSCDIENLRCTRGDYVRVTHDVPMWGLGYARIKTVSYADGITTIVVDGMLPFVNGETYQVRVRQNSGETSTAYITWPGGITTESDTIYVVGDGTSIWHTGNIVMFGKSQSESVELLVQSIEPGPDLTAELKLVPLAMSIYTGIGAPPEHTSYVTIPPEIDRVPALPVVVQIRSGEDVMFTREDGTAESQILIELMAVSSLDVRASYLQAEYRSHDADDDPWERLGEVPFDNQAIGVRPVEDGETYDVRLRAISAYGAASAWVMATGDDGHTVIGRSSLPPDVAILYLEPPGLLSWSYPTPPTDLAGFFVRMNVGIDTTWSSAASLTDVPVKGTYYDIGSARVGIVTYLVKAVDTAGNESATAAALVRDTGTFETANIILYEDKADDGFPGVLTNCSIYDGNLIADDTGGLFWKADTELFWGADTALFWDTQYLAMRYEFGTLPNAEHLPATIWLDHTITGLASIMYRVTQSYFIDDFSGTLTDKWETPTGGTWTIVDGVLEAVHNDAGAYNQYLECKPARVANGTKAWYSVRLAFEHTNVRLGIVLCGKYFEWYGGGHYISTVAATNNPAWTADVWHVWTFEVLASQLINWYVDGAWIGSVSFTATTGDFTLEVVKRVASSPEYKAYFDDVKFYLPVEAWRPWPGTIELDANEFIGWAIETQPGFTQGVISALTVNIDVPDVVEYFNDVAIASGGSRLPLTKSFREIVHVLVTLQDDAGDGAMWKVMDKDATNGPEIEVYDISGSDTTGTIDAEVRGY